MTCRYCDAPMPTEAVFCPLCGKRQQKRKSVKKRGNGTGSVYKRGSTYTAIVTSHRDTRRSVSKGGFATRLQAQAYLHVLRDQLAPHAAEKVISFCELYERWSDKKFNGQLGKPIGKSTVTAYRIAYKRCEPLYTFTDFRQIHYAEMQDVVDALTSYDTQKDVKEMLNQMSRFAMKYEWCDRNYAELLDLTNYTKPEKFAYTDDEVALLWNDYNAGNLFTGYILIMIHCGLRYGELSTIKKEDVHLDDRFMMGGIKSELSRNTPIAISDEILPVIRERLEAGKTKLLRMNEDTFYKTYRATCARVGVRDLNPHCCRHTYITRMTRANIAPATIQKAARHSSYKTTLGYTHINIDDVLAAVNSMPRVIAESELL